MLDVLCMVSKEENLRVTFKHSAKGGLITGATAMVAGILMGPVGLAVDTNDPRQEQENNNHSTYNTQ